MLLDYFRTTYSRMNENECFDRNKMRKKDLGYVRNRTEKRVCKCCGEEKFLCSFSRVHYCRKCAVEGTRLSVEDIFVGNEERKLIPAVKADLAFLKQKAKEAGLLE